jgi:hypothetical protein
VQQLLLLAYLAAAEEAGPMDEEQADVDEEQLAVEAAGGWSMSPEAEAAMDALVDLFGDRYAGGLFDDAGTLVVLVKDLGTREQADATAQLRLDAAAVQVRPARYSEAELEAFANRFTDRDAVSAISFDVEPSQLVLHVGTFGEASELATALGDVPSEAVRIEIGSVSFRPDRESP